MTTKKIMPCPFCGAQPSEPVTHGGGDERCGYNFAVSIGCKCGAAISRSSSSDKNGWCNDKGEAKAAVIESWNSRNGGNAMTTKDEALRIALRALEEIDNDYMALTKRGHEAVAAIKQAQEPVDKCVTWTTGPNEWKDWCAQWFGPDADDDYLAKAVFALPPMAQNFKLAAPKQAQEPVAWVWNPAKESWEQVRAFGHWQQGAIYAFGLNPPAPKQAEPIQPSSQKTLALALEGKELHDYSSPEYIVCAELIRLNKALSGAPTPPEAT